MEANDHTLQKEWEELLFLCFFMVYETLFEHVRVLAFSLHAGKSASQAAADAAAALPSESCNACRGTFVELKNDDGTRIIGDDIRCLACGGRCVCHQVSCFVIQPCFRALCFAADTLDVFKIHFFSRL